MDSFFTSKGAWKVDPNHGLEMLANSPDDFATRDRYAAAAAQSEAALCCPVDYDPQYLKAIPTEVIEKDHGCGDPSKHLHPGETVLDLGSGTGKICFIASQVVGPTGKVIGVDMTDDMLEVARRNSPIVAANIGHANVEFRKGRIQDLDLDLEILDDGGHAMERGKRYAVCDKTFTLYQQAPYRDHFSFVEPLTEIPLAEAKPFDCSGTRERHPKETKGYDYNATTEAAHCTPTHPSPALRRRPRPRQPLDLQLIGHRPALSRRRAQLR